MNPDLRKLAQTFMLAESVSHVEWRALMVKILGDQDESKTCVTCFGYGRHREDKYPLWNARVTPGLADSPIVVCAECNGAGRIHQEPPSVAALVSFIEA